ncbi:hypothetical protein WOLCODRAFT_137276 [Wolfiporia cocos MD-104 SS10]|uniref:Protein kinase domain-containing protein n=1 Tax=Wolfiporia cocos (strain MD-104) TaxID=742152 RepID=A0A2H3JGF4_WOLCO|nr:hypothetical protein WOLCODRAFT_137276 [Wolfiporia cocos MD-104 SS10]
MLKKPPPCGKRPPSMLIWGAELDSFFFTERIPGAPIRCCWTRSMIQEFGENFYELEEIDEEEPDPYVIEPYPLLGIKFKVSEQVEEGSYSLEGILPLADQNFLTMSSNERFRVVAGEIAYRRLITGIQADDDGALAEGVALAVVATDTVIASTDDLDEMDSGNIPNVEDPDEPETDDYADSSDVDAESADEDAEATDVDTESTDNVALRVAVGTFERDLDTADGGNEPTPDPSQPFSNLHKLEEFIPDEYFPDILMVHDPDRLTSGVIKDPPKRVTPYKYDTRAIKYRRVWPKLEGAKEGQTSTSTVPEARVAHLHLSVRHRMGVGHHSLVYRAALTPPDPLTAHSPGGRVTVAAKMSFPKESARDMLENEAKMYNIFPKHLMEDWSGYYLVTPHKFPVPADAVVPKFFGYYVPVDDETSKGSSLGRSPILLLEECGEPIKVEKLSPDERSQCYTHILRLNYLEILQNSIYARNIMVQPGPLSVHPSKRSMEQPSFRVIDFGRGEVFSDWFQQRYSLDNMRGWSSEKIRAAVRPWREKREMQEREIREELQLPMHIT